MKKGTLTAIFLTTCLTTNFALAVTPNTDIVFTCPTVATDLINFGSKIIGHGTEVVGNNTTSSPIQFAGKIRAQQNIPANLFAGNYTSSGTSYSPSNGTVSCSYTSSNGFDPFNVSHKLVNGKGGAVKTSSANSISVTIPVGLNKKAR